MAEVTVAELVQKHGKSEGAAIPLLQDIQEAYTYLPEPVLKEVSEALQVPMSRIFSLATFYKAFSFKPRGRNPINVCLGTACHVRGAPRLVERLQRELRVEKGETTADGQFSLHEVRCLGCCGLAPVVTVGEDVHAHMTSAKIPKLLSQYR